MLGFGKQIKIDLNTPQGDDVDRQGLNISVEQSEGTNQKVEPFQQGEISQFGVGDDQSVPDQELEIFLKLFPRICLDLFLSNRVKHAIPAQKDFDTNIQGNSQPINN